VTPWNEVHLDDCCEIVSGATPSTTAAANWNGDISWVTPADLSGLRSHYISDTPRKLTQRGLESCSASVLPAKSVLFSSRAPIGNVAINTVPMATNQGFKSFIPKPDTIDHKFLFHWLRANRSHIESLGNGATFKEVSKATVSKIKILLPPLPEQRRIAAILDEADALRAKRRESLAQLESLRQSIFIEMFGDPVTNPKGFPARTLGEIIKFEGGSQPPASTFSSEDAPDRIRLVQIRDFKSDRFKTYIPRKLCKRLFEEDDVMIGRYGPPVFQILRGLSGSYNVALMKAVPRDGVTKDFVFHLLKEEQLHNYVVGNSERTAGQSGVNLELLENYQAYLPPEELQIQFSEKMSQLRKMASNMTETQSVSDALFASLQHRAFRGEL
jgi:type I restriction enzyme S subunit